MRKQIGLRMKDETRDQLERVRGGLSRTDYIEGAVLAQIARDLKKTEPERVLIRPIPPEMGNEEAIPQIDEPFFGGGIMGPPVGPQGDIEPIVERRDGSADMERCIEDQIEAQKNRPLNQQMKALRENPPPNGFAVRSSAESKSGVLPVPKKAQKGRR
jgi:hypothetical protein